jgi:dTDP-4-dehydrorhamnose 3,5-epimerase
LDCLVPGVKIRGFVDLKGEAGTVQHFLRADDTEFFRGFGEVYFSTILPGRAKGWHADTQKTSVISCVHGQILLVVEHQGLTHAVAMGDGQRRLVLIPPSVRYAWKNTASVTAILANCATHPYDPSTSRSWPIDAISYDWP